MGHFTTIFAVVHHKHLKILNIGNNKFVEAIGEHMPSLLVGAVPNVWHDNAASLELSTHARIDTLGATPALLRKQERMGGEKTVEGAR